jgi:hypothetical protein
LNQTEIGRPARKHRSRVPRAPTTVPAARLTVAWKPLNHDSVRTEVELVAELDSGLSRTWASAPRVAPSWLEALSSTRCSEVVLTARLGDDVLAKHHVLELAELLTLKLADSQPLIRVLFLPASETI